MLESQVGGVALELAAVALEVEAEGADGAAAIVGAFSTRAAPGSSSSMNGSLKAIVYRLSSRASQSWRNLTRSEKRKALIVERLQTIYWTVLTQGSLGREKEQQRL